MQSAKLGNPTTIYRLGRITGDSKSGVIPTQDLPYLLLKGIVGMGSFPVDLKAPVDILPVDVCVALLAHFIRKSRSSTRFALPGMRKSGRAVGKAKVYHITHPRPVTLPQMCLWLTEKGYHLEGITYSRWRDKLLTQISTSPLATLGHITIAQANPLAPFISNFEPGLSDAKWARFKCDKTIREAENGGFVGTIMDIDAHLIGSYVDFLVRVGALPAPPSPVLNAAGYMGIQVSPGFTSQSYTEDSEIYGDDDDDDYENDYEEHRPGLALSSSTYLTPKPLDPVARLSYNRGFRPSSTTPPRYPPAPGAYSARHYSNSYALTPRYGNVKSKPQRLSSTTSTIISDSPKVRKATFQSTTTNQNQKRMSQLSASTGDSVRPLINHTKESSFPVAPTFSNETRTTGLVAFGARRMSSNSSGGYPRYGRSVASSVYTPQQQHQRESHQQFQRR
jgi:hypothetical protein